MTSSLLAAALATIGLCGDARAGVIVNINEVGPDVVTTGSGTFNLADLTYITYGLDVPGMLPWLSSLTVGRLADADMDFYKSITAPTSFGPGRFTGPKTGAGPLFGVFLESYILEVPHGYVSGTFLSSTNTYTGATFSSLGLTPGTYTWTWGTGANADFFKVRIGQAAVPEPSSLAMLGLGGLALLGHAFRRRRSRA